MDGSRLPPLPHHSWFGFSVAFRPAETIVAEVLRVSEILGGRKPDWEKDTSVFAPHVMKQIVDSIDAHLQRSFCLKDFSSLVGLSESHFAQSCVGRRQSALVALGFEDPGVLKSHRRSRDPCGTNGSESK